MIFSEKRFVDPGCEPEVAQAARWYSCLIDDASEATLAAFDIWYSADAANRHAYAQIEDVVDFAKTAAPSPVIAAMSFDAFKYLDHCRRIRRRVFGVGTILATGACALLLLFWSSLWVAAPELDRRYEAGRDEKLEVMLADGSGATLDSDTSIRIRYDSDRRQVVLERGHALFTVAKDRARPFVVMAGTSQITAHGTIFDVRQDPDKTRVALVEGAVTVSTKTQGRVAKVAMVPNEVLTTDGTAATIYRVQNASRFVRWTDRILIFENEQLVDAVRSLNMSAKRPILLQGEDIGHLRISGVFHANDSPAFIEAVRQYFDLSVENGPHDITLSAPRSTRQRGSAEP